ncbi:MAG: hypothetical protein ACLROI_06695 [Beduini sp.]|uniref:hypothetical protein n=1 Tax=Beduini sp. TaxID=1922300 RepID=UPI0039908E62
MSRFKRQMERGGMSDYEKQTAAAVKKKKSVNMQELKKYASLSWVTLTPVSVLKMFAAYMIVALLIESQLSALYGAMIATILSHGLITSLLVVLLLNGSDGKKANIKELFVRYIIMGLIFGLGTAITSTFIFK